MTKDKIAITVDKDVLMKIRRAVRSKKTPSVSAYFVKLAQDHLENEGWVSLISEMKQSGGEPSAEDYAWAKQQLGF